MTKHKIALIAPNITQVINFCEDKRLDKRSFSEKYIWVRSIKDIQGRMFSGVAITLGWRYQNWKLLANEAKSRIVSETKI